ncbi:heterokaryon incompatibility domain-containing protein [Trichoderma barbatum]
MDLCRDCHSFAWAVSQKLKTWAGMDSFWDEVRFRAGSWNCRLCEMIYNYIFDNPDIYKVVPSSCSYLRYHSFDGCSTVLPSTCVSLVDDGNQGTVEISVWSDIGSPAALSGKICTEPPLPNDNCPEMYAFIRSWIQICSQEHELCRSARSKAYLDEIVGPKLPTRVLDVGTANHEAIYLIETNGQRGDFCALSYCWGREGTQALVTTRGNIKDHLNGIKFSGLPKTFQDAVTITRELGIRYLWIDSLCIIQGDKSDWATESAKMSGVYQKAYLVIAASGAENPKEGCFSQRRRCSTSVEVPYYSPEGQAAGSMRLSMRIHGKESPIWGPLNKRGWALQEWFLARRVLHYMPSGLSWSCEMLQTGERYQYDMERWTDDWETILMLFCQRKLTHKEDRLVALEGLAQANVETTHDRYHLGLFESSLPEGLLWTVYDEAQISEDLADMPHWSWASKGGSKTFWVTQGSKWKSLQHTQVIIDQTGVLKVDGFVAQCRTTIAKSRKKVCTNQQRYHDLLSSVRYQRTDALFWIQTISKRTRTIGVAIFDRERFARVRILFLKRWMDYHQLGIRESRRSRVGGNIVRASTIFNANQKPVNEQTRCHTWFCC